MARFILKDQVLEDEAVVEFSLKERDGEIILVGHHNRLNWNIAKLTKNGKLCLIGCLNLPGICTDKNRKIVIEDEC